jgi:hypothetical protein
MITIKEWMELVDYRITEGDSYRWRCFGDNAQSLSSWNGDHDGWSFNIVFDTKTQEVYTVEVCDYKRQRAYRMIHPDFKQAHDDEAASRGVDSKEAWDDVDYVDLEIDEDFAAKAMWIKTDQDYDTRVSVPLTVPDDVLFELMKRAHNEDITLNEYVENVLWETIDAKDNKRILDSQYPDGDEYWREDLDDAKGWDKIAEDHWDDDGDDIHETNTDNPVDFPASAMKAKKKKKK